MRTKIVYLAFSLFFLVAVGIEAERIIMSGDGWRRYGIQLAFYLFLALAAIVLALRPRRKKKEK